MSRQILKSAIYAAARQRYVLHANFNGHELTGYSVTVQCFDPHATGSDPDCTEEVEHFLVNDAATNSHMAYVEAAERYREIVLPTL